MKAKGEVIFNLALMAIFTGALLLCLGWPDKARMYPLMIAIGGVAFTGWLVYTSMTGKAPKKTKKRKITGDTESSNEGVTVQSELKMILWLAGYLAFVLICGFWVAIAVFIPFFMRRFGKESWGVVGTFTAVLWATIFLTFHVLMEVSLFGGVLGLAWD